MATTGHPHAHYSWSWLPPGVTGHGAARGRQGTAPAEKRIRLTWSITFPFFSFSNILRTSSLWSLLCQWASFHGRVVAWPHLGLLHWAMPQTNVKFSGIYYAYCWWGLRPWEVKVENNDPTPRSSQGLYTSDTIDEVSIPNLLLYQCSTWPPTL